MLLGQGKAAINRASKQGDDEVRKRGRRGMVKDGCRRQLDAKAV